MKRIYIVVKKIREGVHTETEIMKVFTTFEQAEMYIKYTPIEWHPFVDAVYFEIVEKWVEEE